MKNSHLISLISILFIGTILSIGYCRHKENISQDTDQYFELEEDFEGYLYPLNVFFKDTINQNDSLLVVESISYANTKFANANIKFSINFIKTHPFPPVEELDDAGHHNYFILSDSLDQDTLIGLWIVDNDEGSICKTNSMGQICRRTGGFSFIGSQLTSNVVVSRFDLHNPWILSHELGHYFSLLHTFEEDRHGKELPDGSNCETAGDKICDTPADPYTDVSVAYGICEMLYSEYKPMINNIMAYYKPCINKPYKFTPQQLQKIEEFSIMVRYKQAIFIKSKKNLDI